MCVCVCVCERVWEMWLFRTGVPFCCCIRRMALLATCRTIHWLGNTPTSPVCYRILTQPLVQQTTASKRILGVLCDPFVDFLRNGLWAANSPDLNPVEWAWGHLQVRFFLVFFWSRREQTCEPKLSARQTSVCPVNFRCHCAVLERKIRCHQN